MQESGANVSELFQVMDIDRRRHVREALSARQDRLVSSAIVFHALDNPGAELTAFIYIANAGDHTHYTDFSTRRGEHGTNAQFVGSFAFRSLARGNVHQHYSPVQGKWVPDVETGERHIIVDRDPETVTAHATLSRLSPYWRLRAEAERRFPAQYDFVRQRLLHRREAELNTRRIPRERVAAIPAEPSLIEGPKAILFGLHWLDLGGAERWAVETIRLARSEGFVPIVITDVPSSHSWITKAELDGAIVITLTHPVGQPEHSEPLLEAILANYDLSGVFVHHSMWLYDRLPWLRAHLPQVPIVETLHILEYNGGGYPYHGARYDDYIDIHHVISPQLKEWLIGVQGVAPEKVALAPLFGLTTLETPQASAVKSRRDRALFTVAFVGRLAHQKRPYLFVRLARRLVDSGLPVKFILHGSGELEDFVRHQVTKFKLNDVVEFATEKIPVAETLAKSDLLVVSSQNEGVTLTTIEAIEAGVPVLSADVGSQSTLVAPDLLVPRSPQRFIDESERIVRALVESEPLREKNWQQERQLANEFASLRPAHEWTKELYTKWQQ
ncbi:glycosyltransferase [Mycetocola zhadangensis]|uniref:Glycosyltransferase n=1 Tax=Mycetocola zhadangensis TaxID=1164595 RepID=A0A3L7IWA5_9MICO|nr:glycosyltransferase [Mycetocola zhadangensis]RLQ81534.1 glycosyltransferase [Mycetocola zhadangensis]RLQ82488.1 glycosyltransferase [Mycetocola zhadangensis]GGF00888.1 glycosyl transferase [Mycetocola zhadangensis]